MKNPYLNSWKEGLAFAFRQHLFSERPNRAASRLILLDLFVARERGFWNLAVYWLAAARVLSFLA